MRPLRYAFSFEAFGGAFAIKVVPPPTLFKPSQEDNPVLQATVPLLHILCSLYRVPRGIRFFPLYWIDRLQKMASSRFAIRLAKNTSLFHFFPKSSFERRHVAGFSGGLILSSSLSLSKFLMRTSSRFEIDFGQILLSQDDCSTVICGLPLRKICYCFHCTLTGFQYP